MIQFTATKGEEEFHLIHQTKNSPVKAETDYIWILSSRHDIYGAHINCAQKSKNFVPFESSTDKAPEEICDVKDDYERIKAALLIGQSVTTLRAGKKKSELLPLDYEQYAPHIIYNGWSEQNASLRMALDKSDLSSLGLISYPASKFFIFDMPEKQQHTGGQFTSLALLAEREPKLHKLKEEKCSVTIVTSAYHIPRVRRLFDSNEFKNPFRSQTQITFYGVDRSFNRPCAQRDLHGELERLKKYTDIGHIGEPAYGDWYDIKSIQYWTPLRQIYKADAPVAAVSTQPDTKAAPRRHSFSI